MGAACELEEGQPSPPFLALGHVSEQGEAGDINVVAAEEDLYECIHMTAMYCCYAGA